MLARRDRLVAPQRLPRVAGDRVRHRRRRLCRDQDSGGRDPGPVRCAGHRVHRVSRPGAAGRRGPGHVPADHGDDRCPALEGRARFLVLRRLVRLHHLRGRYRHLLGTFARARVPQRGDSASALRRVPDTRARRHGRRLGLSVRGHGCQSVAGRVTHFAGLVHQVPAVEGVWRVRGGVDRRLRPAVRRHGRSAQAAGVQPAAVEDHRDDPHEQPRCRRADRRDVGDRIHGARHRLPARRRRISRS